MAPPIGGSIETRFHQVGGATKKSIKVGGVLVKIGVGWWNPGMRLVESRWSLVEIDVRLVESRWS